MTFILFILTLIGFAYLNGRINSLESLFRSHYSPRSATTPANSAPTMSTAGVPVVPAVQQPEKQTVGSATQSVQLSGEEISGQWLGRFGAFAIFAGIAFFLQYAFSHDIIGPAGRIATGFIIAILFVVLGVQLVHKYRWYASLLSGAGIAILYVTIACAHIFYGFISAPVSLGLILATTALSVFMSAHISVRTLATFGIVGGFLTPLFVDFSASPSDLLVYYALYNIGILAVSFIRRWPALTALAFAGTALSVTRWILSYYNESQYLWTVVIFVTVYFLTFLAATLTHHIVRREESTAVDVALTIINGLGYFALCWSLLDSLYHSTMGYYALAMAALYFAVGYLCHYYNERNTGLNVALPALGVVFVSIAIPLYFHENWIPFAWLLEAVVLYLVSFKIRNANLQWLGAAVFVIGALKALFTAGYAEHAFINTPFAIVLVSVAAAYCIAYLHRMYPDRVHDAGTSKLALALYVGYANVVTVESITRELFIYFQKSDQYDAVVTVFWALYAIGLMAIGIMKRVPMLRKLSLVLFALAAFRLFIELWGLGEVYRIVTFIVFGGIALIGSFAYSKYKDRIAQI